MINNSGGALVAASVLTMSAFAPAAALAAGSVAAGGDVSSGLSQSILTATDNTAGSGLGNAIAISGNTVVVGAFTRKVGGNVSEGQVEVFQRPATGWGPQKQVATLTEPNGAANDVFGDSVAIWGRTIVVGATERHNSGGVETGEVYVYTEPKGGWVSSDKPTAVLVPKSGMQYGDFGASVAVNGNTIVVGAWGTGSGTFDGAAYVFSKPATGWKSGTETGQLAPANGTADFEFYGAHVAISGNTVLISGSGRYNNAGRVFVFVKPATGWAPTANENRQLVGSQTTNSYFGASLAISGNTVVVGEPEGTVDSEAKAGSAYVFVRPAAGWGSSSTPQVPPAPAAVLTASDLAAGDEFGEGVGIGGGRIVVGATEKTVGANDHQGKLYLFLPQSGHWVTETETSTLTASSGAPGDGLGEPVAVSPTAIAAGAPQRSSDLGAAYVFAMRGPRLTKPGQAHHSWALGSAKPVINPAKPPAGGTSFHFTLSGSATVALTFSEKAGKRVRHRGVLVVHARAGVNTVYVDGPTAHGKKLSPGHCAVVIAARNAYGGTAPRTLRFVTKR